MKNNFSKEWRTQTGEEETQSIDLTNLGAYETDALRNLSVQLRIKSARILNEIKQLNYQISTFQREKALMAQQIKFYRGLINTLIEEIKERQLCDQPADAAQPAKS